MKSNAILVAGALLCASAVPAFAQTVTAATQASDAVWWSELANQGIAALSAFLVAAVAALAPMLFAYIRSKSNLASILMGQAMLDKLVLGIQNQIRAEATRLQARLPGGSTPDLSPQMKADIATNVQPKIEAAFKETLQHFGKAPGSQAVKDMILGHVDATLQAITPATFVNVGAAGAKVPFPQNRG